MELNEFLSYFKGVKKTGSGYMALCPAHHDHTPSLSIGTSENGDKILFNCFSGCSTEAILSAVGLTASDLFMKRTSSKPAVLKETVYRYSDTDGALLYSKVRRDYEDGTKAFFFTQPNGTKGVKGIKRVPYNLPAVYQADKVYFVEGEKCAEAIIKKGYCATTLDSGSNSKWLPEYSQYFKEKEVVIIPDNDAPGLKYANSIAQKIPNACIKQLPGLAEKEDIFDWLAAGHTMAEVDALPEIKLSHAETTDEPNEERSGMPQAEMLLHLFKKSGARIFCNERNELYAAIPIDSHTEIIEVDSKEFSCWLRHLYFQEVGRSIRADALSQAAATLTSVALYGNKERICLYNRVAPQENAIWYDLSNTSWQAIKVSANGWSVENTPPILFNRYRHQSPQVQPKHSGDISKIFQYVNVKEYRTLFLCWLVSSFVPEIPHPMLIIYGEKGAAKSTACVLLKRLIDPSVIDTLSLHNDQRTLVINLQQHWMLPFDNVSAINGETSDMLCRAITGGSVQQRKLYTNTEDSIFTFKRCLAINGISNVANRSDLLDRSLLFELERVPETERKELAAVYEAFENDRPNILGGIFDVLSAAMSLLPSVKLDRLPRMADFGRWGYAIAEALGGHGERFLKEYEQNRALQNSEAINADAVATLTIAFMQGRGEWSGLVSKLLTELTELAPNYGISKNAKSLPTQPNALTRRLNGMKSNLEEVGVTFSRKDTPAGTKITLHNARLYPSPSYHVDLTTIPGLRNGDNHGDPVDPDSLPPSKIVPNPNESGDSGDDGDDFDGLGIEF